MPDHEDTLARLASILNKPGAIEALGELVDVQLGLDAIEREREIDRPPLVEVAEDGALILVIPCARRTVEQTTTDRPASRCAWLPDPAIGGHRCRVCRRVEAGSMRARQLDALRNTRNDD